MLDFGLSAFHEQNLVEGARMALQAHNLKDGSPFESVMTSHGEMPVVARVQYRPRLNSSMIVWRFGPVMAVAFSGLDFGNDALGFFNGAESPVRHSNLPGRVNSFASAWANNTRSRFMDQLTQGVLSVWIYGHSMGATQAHLMGWEAKQFRPNLLVNVVTFGSPKWCDFVAARALMVNRNYRIMNTRDSMTYVVPTITQAPLFSALFPARTLLDFATTVHLPNGFIMDDNGAWSETNDPAGLPSPLDWNIDQFIRAMTDTNSPHNMSEYLRRILLAFPPNEARGHTGLNLDTSLSEADAPERVNLETMKVRARAIAQWLDNRAPLPAWVRQDRSRIKIVRQGHRYVVKLDGTQMYIATSKNDAKGVANAMRTFMRQVIQQPGRFMNTNGLIERFHGFIAAPGNPDLPL